MSIDNDAACMAKKMSWTRSSTGEKTSAAYLVAPVESGQPTHLAGHVADMADRHNAGPVFYIAERHAESVYQFARYLDFDSAPDDVVSLLKHSDHMADEGEFSTGELVFCAYDTISWQAVPRRCVFVVEVSLYCTTQAELFFSKLLGRCADPRNRHAVLCHAARLSTRTVMGFKRSVPPGSSIPVIEVPDTRAKLTPETVNPARFVEEARKAIDDAEGAVVALVDHALGKELLPPGAEELDFLPELREYEHIGDMMPKFRRGDARLRVGPELGFVSPCPHLRLLVSRRERTMATFDKTTSMLVDETRGMGVHELVQEQAWIRRAVVGRIDGSPETIRYLVADIDSPAHSEASWGDDVDPQGPAYNCDLLETLLRLTELRQDLPFKMWPCRPAPDHETLAEGFRQLSMMGCIQEREGGVIRLTMRGQATLEAFATFRNSTVISPNFETVCLVATAKELSSLRVRRVVILMALINVFPGMLIIEDNGTLLQFREEYTWGVGYEHFARGWLWLALGFILWQFGRPNQHGLPIDVLTPVKFHGVSVLLNSANCILSVFHELSQGFDKEAEESGEDNPLVGLFHADNVDRLTKATELDEAEVHEAEWALFEVLNTRCVLVERNTPDGIPTAIEQLNARRANVGARYEAVFGTNLESRDEAPRFTAIYSFVKVPKIQNEPFLVSELTYIPRDICCNLNQESAQLLPWSSETLYPHQD
ncbi:hypothetical protein PG999_014316 [Apiospora kogelbergensis]|uniref:Uncharacterized protein n=1 Tax=Apiospora kogelbergensis TaxID=1337665 RepID=A0AAW0Q708_9PEZI